MARSWASRKGKEMEKSLATHARKQTCEQRDLSSKAIREFLTKAGEVCDYVFTSRQVAVWVDALADYPAEKLSIMFRRTLETFKPEYGRKFPVLADVLQHAEKTKESATSEAAEFAFKQVLDIRRTEYNPDLPQYLARALAKLPERVRRAARTAGIFREHESVEALHVWAKKVFIESFLRWDESADSLALLPEGDIKKLLTEAAETKALPAPPVDFHALQTRGLEYSASLKREPPALSPEARLLAADNLAAAAREIINRDKEKQTTITVSEGDREAFRKQAERIKALYPESKTTDPVLLRFISPQREVTP
jgi:hypothetical protein